MSLLLGVRGSSQKNEGQSFRESIMQQPGSFYNGNPSSSIWGSPPTQPLWPNLMDQEPQEQQWQHSFAGRNENAKDEIKQEDVTSIKGQGYGFKRDNIERFASTGGPSDPLMAPFRFGFSSQPTVFMENTMASGSFHFVSKGSTQEFLGESSGTLFDEGGRKVRMEANANLMNQKTWETPAADKNANEGLDSEMAIPIDELTKDLKSRLSLQGFPRFSSSNFQKPIPSAEEMENMHSASDSGDKGMFRAHASNMNMSRPASFIQPQGTSSHKENPEVFVFGASGSLGTGLKADTQQKSLHSSSSRSRTSKFKRQTNVVKGKGVTALGGIYSQQASSDFSRDASPQSNATLATESHFDEGECSQFAEAYIWPEENLDIGANLESSEVLQQLHTSDQVGVDLNADKPTSHVEGSTTTMEDSHVLDQQDSYEKTQFDKHRPNFGMCSSSFSSFSKKNNEEVNDKGFVEAFNASKPGYLSSNSNARQENLFWQPHHSTVKSTAFHEESYVKELRNQMGSLPGIPEPTGNSNVSQELPTKEPIDRASNRAEYFSTTNYQNDDFKSTWNTSSKEPPKPFIFGASQTSKMQADIMNGRVSNSTGDLKDDQINKSFPLGCMENIFPGLASSSEAFPAGIHFNTSVFKGMDGPPILPSVMPRNGEPTVRPFYSSSLSDAMGQFSFVVPDNEGSTGEFSGPVSSSESSSSERSPIRDEQRPAGEPLSQNQCFEFQGSTKETNVGLALGKKKTRASLNIRKHGRGMNRQRRAGHSISFKDTATTPMDFSPGTNDAARDIGTGNQGQMYLNLNNRTSNMDDGDIWRHLSEIQSMKEGTGAALGIGHSQEIFNLHNEDPGLFEDLHEWSDQNSSSKRSGTWKRAGIGEGHGPTSSLENPLMAQHFEREDDTRIGERTLFNGEGSHLGTPFIFGASSEMVFPSPMHPGYAPKEQKEKSTDMVEGSIHIDSTSDGQDGSGTTEQDMVSKENGGAGYILSQGTVDKKGPHRVLRTSLVKNNQNVAHKKVEELKVESTLTGEQLVTGMPESSSAVKSAAAEQVCERWRLRGNQAYANGDFPKAEEYYSRGASSVSPDETSQSCIRASMLCYSNRAATRMAVGRMREALADCKRAMVVDPSFLRVRLRAASCHLALGEIKVATNMFNECLKYAKEGMKPDPKVLAEAMEGAKKSQQLDDYSERALELLQKQNLTDSTAALRVVNEALSISSYSESLYELKAQILLSLWRYEECLQLCKQSLPAAERNHGFVVNEHHHQQDNSFNEACQSSENLHLTLWRWRLSAKALYHLGRLDESLELLIKHEEALTTSPIDKVTNSDSLSTFMASVRDLLRHKAAGNEAFQVGKHAEAVEHYTAALACNGDSRPYNAVCFCNRAAASQALGNIADAIADCSRAIALDSAYPKALSRRATLHELIRDYGQACNDLRRLIALLEDYQLHGKNNEATSKGGGSNINAQDLRQARERLEKGEEEMKKGHPIDHYLVLGVDFSCSANEIKKAYRKAALKHHPDKAGQFLVRGENGDDGSLWKEVGEEVRRDSERLFKLIGEAYAILWDPTKRLRYDTEEEHRKLRGKDNNNPVTSEGYRSQYEKSGRRQRDRWDTWQGYAPQQQRWQSGPDAAQPDTYGRRSTYGADATKTGRSSWNTDFSWDKI